MAVCAPVAAQNAFNREGGGYRTHVRMRWLVVNAGGEEDIDPESTEVTRTGVAYRRRFAASSLSAGGTAVLQCSMLFQMAVQPTASLPELDDSTVPPDYTFNWRSSPIRVVGECDVFAAQAIKS